MTKKKSVATPDELITRDMRITALAQKIKKFKDMRAAAMQKKHVEAHVIENQYRQAMQLFEILKRDSLDEDLNWSDSEFDRYEGNITSLFDQSTALYES